MIKSFLLIAFVISLTACGSTESSNQKSKPMETIPSLTEGQQMDTVFFWKIMNYAYEKGIFDNKIKEQIILDQLIKLTPEEIQNFEIIFQQINKKASTWANFTAHTVIEGSSSDDRFYYFRCWLISLGQKNFDEILKDPDYLASLDIPVSDKKYGATYCWFEELISVSDRAYEIVTKKDPMTDTTFPRDHADKLGLFYDSATELTGEEWNNTHELPKIVPLLYKKYSPK
jgi:hypothetical protein